MTSPKLRLADGVIQTGPGQGGLLPHWTTTALLYLDHAHSSGRSAVDRGTLADRVNHCYLGKPVVGLSTGVIKEGNVLFNDALNTFYLRFYGVRHLVKDHSDSEKGNPLPPHRLLLSNNSKGSSICTIPQTG